MDTKESGYIEHQRQRELESRDAQLRLDSIVEEFRRLPDSSLPPIWMMQKIGSHSIEHFRNTAAWSFVELLRRGKLGTSSRIIDIGSGCGRIALPFSLLIDNGVYYGTDVFEDGVNWCAQNISNRAPNFKFFLQTVENNYYFGGEALPSESLSLAFAESSSIDFVFALSVFTHLVEEDASRYLHEIARTLRPDGVAYLTCFIIDKNFQSFVLRSGLHTAVKEVSEGHYQAYSGQDFFGGYSMQRWQALLSRAGLEISGFDPGTWAEKPGAMHYQDTFIITKR